MLGRAVSSRRSAAFRYVRWINEFRLPDRVRTPEP